MKMIRSTALIALILPVSAFADIHAFIGMPMTATQEDSVESNGYGSVTVLYDTDTKTLMYSAVWQLNPESTATNGHFHGPAGIGESAGVAVGLPTKPTGNAGTSTGTVTLMHPRKQICWLGTGI